MKLSTFKNKKNFSLKDFDESLQIAVPVQNDIV